MLYSVVARFKTDASVEERRKAAHEDFNAHLMQPFLKIRLGGPLRAEDGRLRGVMLLIEADSYEQVQRFVALSPYTRAGLYDRVDIEELHLQVGRIA